MTKRTKPCHSCNAPLPPDYCPTCTTPMPHQHCFDCGAREPHAVACPGPIDWAARKARARALLTQRRLAWQAWADLDYQYEDEP